MSIISQSKAYYWTSMSIMDQSKTYFGTTMPIVSQCKTYYWTSRSIDFVRKPIHGPIHGPQSPFAIISKKDARRKVMQFGGGFAARSLI